LTQALSTVHKGTGKEKKEPCRQQVAPYINKGPLDTGTEVREWMLAGRTCNRAHAHHQHIHHLRGPTYHGCV